MGHHLPQIFILESTKDRSFTDAELPKTLDAMQAFVSKVLAGSVLPKYSSFSALWAEEAMVGVARQYGLLIGGTTTVLFLVLYLMSDVANADYEDDEVKDDSKKKQ